MHAFTVRLASFRINQASPNARFVRLASALWVTDRVVNHANPASHRLKLVRATATTALQASFKGSLVSLDVAPVLQGVLPLLRWQLRAVSVILGALKVQQMPARVAHARRVSTKTSMVSLHASHASLARSRPFIWRPNAPNVLLESTRLRKV